MPSVVFVTRNGLVVYDILAYLWYKDVKSIKTLKGTTEILQRAHIFKANCCLKVDNAHLKLASPISG